MSAGQASPEGLGRPFALVGALIVVGLLVTAGVGAMRVARPTTVEVEHADAEPFEVICHEPEPNSTIGEARAFRALA